MLKRIDKLSAFLNICFIGIGGIALLVMIGIACTNMLLRPLGSPLKGAYELVGFLGALTVALPLGYSQKSRSHISVDVVSSSYSKRTHQMINAISSLLAMIFFILVAWQSFVYGSAIMKRGETSETLRIIYHPFIYLVAICCVLLALVLFVDFLKSLLLLKRNPK